MVYCDTRDYNLWDVGMQRTASRCFVLRSCVIGNVNRRKTLLSETPTRSNNQDSDKLHGTVELATSTRLGFMVHSSAARNLYSLVAPPPGN
jgi:hypothetical protein